jgi:hypothetical protein
MDVEINGINGQSPGRMNEIIFNNAEAASKTQQTCEVNRTEKDAKKDVYMEEVKRQEQQRPVGAAYVGRRGAEGGRKLALGDTGRVKSQRMYVRRIGHSLEKVPWKGNKERRLFGRGGILRECSQEGARSSRSSSRTVG